MQRNHLTAIETVGLIEGLNEHKKKIRKHQHLLKRRLEDQFGKEEANEDQLNVDTSFSIKLRWIKCNARKKVYLDSSAEERLQQGLSEQEERSRRRVSAAGCSRTWTAVLCYVTCIVDSLTSGCTR
ncbi:hypothetical protein J6590_044878 [Homalodisca vitripennis]|nr:hypothetical protein J6590_044878 [Homalodisca vitripennis]